MPERGGKEEGGHSNPHGEKLARFFRVTGGGVRRIPAILRRKGRYDWEGSWAGGRGGKETLGKK